MLGIEKEISLPVTAPGIAQRSETRKLLFVRQRRARVRPAAFLGARFLIDKFQQLPLYSPFAHPKVTVLSSEYL